MRGDWRHVSQPIVNVEDLTKVYQPSPPWMKVLVRSNITQPVTALDGISFSVNAGEILAVVGPNGAGKTTAFRVLVGLTTLSSGVAEVLGRDVTKESISVRREVGWMPAEDRSLLMRLTCVENLRFHGRLQGMGTKELGARIEESLEMVGLLHVANHVPFALSAGMKSRLQLARALLHEPRLLILDEPTGSVDPVGAHELISLIMDIVKRQQIAALISSHRLEEIEALHSHVILLDRGKIRYDGNLDHLRSQWDRPRLDLEFDDTLAAARGKASILTSKLGTVAELEDRTLRVTVAPGVSSGDVLHGLADELAHLAHLREYKLPLRDILAEMYGSGRGDPE